VPELHNKKCTKTRLFRIRSPLIAEWIQSLENHSFGLLVPDPEKRSGERPKRDAFSRRGISRREESRLMRGAPKPDTVRSE
jgi:hypothetical protein